ncbi:MAG TPA: hypothetical protein VK698_02230 [Kofleriaceae bacterium]|nr:hypothetical protein [Kofleriaceae bacterium]
MDPLYLFLETCLDLEARLNEAKPYSLIRASALLRQLLLDGTPLIHRANRQFRLKLKFSVRSLLTMPDGLPQPAIQFLGDALDGGLDMGRVPGFEIKSISFDQFIAHHVMQINENRYSIGDVIGFLANVWGGVHLNEPRSPADTHLVTVDSSIVFASRTPLMTIIHAIGQVTLRTIQPLRPLVQQSLEAVPPASAMYQLEEVTGSINIPEGGENE